MWHPKFMCHLFGCRKGYFVPLIIEFGFNGQTKQDAKKQLEEILPGIRSRLREVLEQYPTRMFIGDVTRQS
jgi:hypothetical protein